ncbi:cysteine proteinase [Testicularia cyperi]|uniref:ubiquitinyl hydrolase 1 n=1 Tax=Testicularia cyperi TaxID=1882483 RepID=A0A317XQ20_9BASI|nr:cysteine proteinase [Testicularia cyperi]
MAAGQRTELDSDSAAVFDSVTNSSATQPADASPVDITLDEDDHRKVSLKSDTDPTPLLNSHSSSGAAAEGGTSPEYDDTPIDHAVQPSATQSLLPLSSQTSMPAVTTPSNADAAEPLVERFLMLPAGLYDSGLVFNPKLSLLDVQFSQNDVAPAATTTSSEDIVQPSIQPPGLAEFIATKPHPRAYFVPETLEWKVVLRDSDLVRKPGHAGNLLDVSHISDACNLPTDHVNMYETRPVTIPAEAQRTAIRQGRNSKDSSGSTAASEPPVIEEFNMHRCYITGAAILSTPPDTITSAVDRRLLEDFRTSREQDPAVGMTGTESFVRALRVLVRILGNAVHGEIRSVATNSITMTQKLGWDNHARAIIDSLGWHQDTMPDGRQAIRPPSLFGSDASDHWRLRRLIRAWIELSAWLAFHVALLRQTKPGSAVIEGAEYRPQTLVRIESAAGQVAGLLGLTEDQIDFTYPMDPPQRTGEALFELGASAQSVDELVKFAYLVNLQASPSRAPQLFNALDEVFTSQRKTSRTLEQLLSYERSQGKFSSSDLDKAYDRLHLSVTYLGNDVSRENIPLDFMVDNYKARAREAVARNDAGEYTAAREALRMIAVSRANSQRLINALNESIDMDVEQAYSVLQAGPVMDDVTLQALFDIHIGDSPASTDMLRQALLSIAEHRNSSFLRTFLRTGEKDPSGGDGWQPAPSSDLPAGINNIGNTCYLNSVLQYFFSIREIRDRVLQAATPVATPTATEVVSSTTTAAKALLAAEAGRRVGGRHITLRELQRSKRFVNLLAGLFHQLIYTPDLAVTPERELAYLALVSSRAEELEGGFSSDITAAAAILTDEPAAQTATGSGSTEIASSVDATQDGIEPSQSTVVDTTIPEATTTTLPGPPPLPPRPDKAMQSNQTNEGSAREPVAARRNSLMQLGAQQDVSECLDNCMFQLEVALAMSKDKEAHQAGIASQPVHETSATDIDADDDEDVDALNDDLLTSLFLGKTCQRIETEVAGTTSGDTGHTRPSVAKQNSTHIKKEIFKILPIDVLEEGRDIYDGLDGFFDSETFVSTSGAVQRRSVTLLSPPPPLLQIQLQRVQYDRKTMRAFKSQAHLEMDETIYVDRYVDLNPADAEDAQRLAKRHEYQWRRHQIGELRNKIAACKGDNGRPLAQTLSQTANLVEELARLPSLGDLAKQLDEVDEEGGDQLHDDGTGGAGSLSPRSQAKRAANQDESAANDVSVEAESGGNMAGLTTTEAPLLASLVDSGLASMLRTESTTLTEELREAEERIKTLKAEMASIWSDEQRFAYRLVAVFMHRGEASHGHYFLHLGGTSSAHDASEGEAKWFKYNDSAVTPLGKDQVVRDSSGATPYLVTYVRTDQLHLIDPICRQLTTNSTDAVEADDGRLHPPPVSEAEEQDELQSQSQSQSTSQPQLAVDTSNSTAAITELAVKALNDQSASSNANVGDESPIKRARTDV